MFAKDEIDLILPALRFREKLPKFEKEKNSDPKPHIKPNPDEKPDKPTNLNDTSEIDKQKREKERLAKIKKEFEDKIAIALKTAENFFAKEKFEESAKDYLVAISLGQRIETDYFEKVEKSEIYLSLARAFFGYKKFLQASQYIQQYLTINNAEKRNSIKIFEYLFKEKTFSANFEKLDQFCILNDNDADAVFLLAYLNFSQGNHQNCADLFSEVKVLNANPLADWYLTLLAKLPYKVKPNSDPKVKAKKTLKKAASLLKKQKYKLARIEFQKAYRNDLTDAENVKALSGLLVCLFYEATDSIGLNSRSDYYSTCSDYLRKYLQSQDESKWKSFKLDLIKTFPKRKDYEKARKTLINHTLVKNVDFEAFYFRAFIHYFEKKYTDAVASFDIYLNTMNRDINPEVYYFRGASKHPNK